MEKNIKWQNNSKNNSKKKKSYINVFIQNLNDYEDKKMSDVQEIKKVKIYKRRLRDWFFLTIVLWFVIFLLSFYKNNNFINYVFWFILVANGILFITSIYVFIITLLKSVEIVKIAKEFDLDENSIKSIFKY